MIALSPGIADGCFELLRLADTHPMSFDQLRHELPKIGGIEIERLSVIAQDLGWLRANDSGVAVLAPAGAKLLAIGPQQHRLRQALLDYVEVFRPPWIKNAIDGRLKTISYAPGEIGQSLVEAELATGYADDVVAFWDHLAGIARGLRGAELSVIGRAGERLSMQYELARTGKIPKWKSVESNSDGYDVLSVMSREDARLRPIEVKTSTVGIRGSFFITRNEWETAELMPTHTFHFWDISNRNDIRLAVVDRKDIGAHVPQDAGEGNWKEVEIRFSPFREAFAPAKHS